MKVNVFLASVTSALFSLSPVALAESQPVTLNFQATVNGKAFDCQQSYADIGTQKSTVQVQDFRLYVSGLRLIDETGAEVPVTLEQNPFQYQKVALLDFENATGHCQGTPATHTTITGTVPPGRYRGLSFEVGVPFDLNHRNVASAPSPLNMSSMFWVWRSGYKFARIDLKSTGMPQGYFIHLGSTECLGSAKGSTPERATEAPLQCERPNRPTVTLAHFDPQQSHLPIRLDLARLLSTSNVNTNQPQTAAGCMAGKDDTDCTAIFEQLGLGKGPQQFFVWETEVNP